MARQILTNKWRSANLLLAASLLTLQACSGVPWEKDFWTPPAASGVVPIEGGQTYPIRRASGENLSQEWPNLADVPPRTANPLPAGAAQTQLQQLEADRAAANTRASHTAVAPARPSSIIAVPDQSPSPPPEL